MRLQQKTKMASDIAYQIVGAVIGGLLFLLWAYQANKPSTVTVNGVTVTTQASHKTAVYIGLPVFGAIVGFLLGGLAHAVTKKPAEAQNNTAVAK